MITELTCSTTEFSIIPEIDNDETVFCIHDKCLIISCINEKEDVLYQTEIDIKDAIELARTILLKTGYLKL